MPVSAFDFLSVTLCYLLVAVAPFILIHFIFSFQSPKKNVYQVSLAVVFYPLFFIAWNYFASVLATTAGLGVIGLYTSLFMTTLVLAALLILIRNFIKIKKGPE